MLHLPGYAGKRLRRAPAILEHVDVMFLPNVFIFVDGVYCWSVSSEVCSTTASTDDIEDIKRKEVTWDACMGEVCVRSRILVEATFSLNIMTDSVGPCEACARSHAG